MRRVGPSDPFDSVRRGTRCRRRRAPRDGHPLGAGPLTAERLAGAVHVAVSRRGRRHGAVHEALDSHGLRRRVLTVLPTSAAPLAAVSRTDAVTVVPERACAPAIASLGLHARALPFELPAVPVLLVRHRRMQRDPEHAWLRANAREILHDVLHGPGRPAARPHE